MMTGEFIEILRDHLGVDEDKIEQIKALNTEGTLSPVQAIKSQGLLDEHALLQVSSLLLGLEVLPKIPSQMIDATLASSFTLTYLKQKKALPLRDGDKRTLIAVNDPFDYETIDHITKILGLGFIETVLCTEEEIGKAINMAFEEGPHTAEQILKDIDEEEGAKIYAEIEETTDLLEDTSEAPVIQFVNLMLSKAVKNRASDIHIEPYQLDLIVRLRIDGLLYNTFKPPKRLHPSIVSRIKVMSGLNIAEKRIPQD